MLIKDMMTKDVITVKEDDSVQKCANLLMTHGLTGLPVMGDKGKVTGMITEGDLIRRASRVRGPATLEILGGIFYLDSPKTLMDKLKKTMGNVVEDIMTKDVITVDLNEDIESAATLMVQRRIKRLPVLDENESLVGIISRKDIMNYLFDKETI